MMVKIFLGIRYDVYSAFLKIPRVLGDKRKDPMAKEQGDAEKSLQGSRHTQPTRLPHEEVRKTLPNRTPPRKTSHPSPTSSPWTSRQTLNFRGSSENKRSRYMIVQRLKGLQTHSTRFLQIKNYYCFQVLIVSARV